MNVRSANTQRARRGSREEYFYRNISTQVMKT